MRADFLSRLGRKIEARAELERAASLTKNARERALLLERAASAFTLKGRYLLDLKKGYYAGASYEKLGGPADEPYSSNVFRLMLGQQL